LKWFIKYKIGHGCCFGYDCKTSIRGQLKVFQGLVNPI